MLLSPVCALDNPLLAISLDLLRIFGQRDGQGGKAKTVPSLLAKAAALFPLMPPSARLPLHGALVARRPALRASDRAASSRDPNLALSSAAAADQKDGWRRRSRGGQNNDLPCRRASSG